MIIEPPILQIPGHEPPPLIIRGRGGNELVRFDEDGTVWIEGEQHGGDPELTAMWFRKWADAVLARVRWHSRQTLEFDGKDGA
jgi:hypothetical protein